jgi:hypothetical protein
MVSSSAVKLKSAKTKRGNVVRSTASLPSVRATPWIKPLLKRRLRLSKLSSKQRRMRALTAVRRAKRKESSSKWKKVERLRPSPVVAGL